MRSTTHYFGTKISHMIVEAEGALETKDEAIDIIHNIKDAFEQIIDEAEWMDNRENRRKN